MEGAARGRATARSLPLDARPQLRDERPQQATTHTNRAAMLRGPCSINSLFCRAILLPWSRETAFSWETSSCASKSVMN